MMSSDQTSRPASRRPVIILTGGGSGGHIVPLLSVARELKRQSSGCYLVYVGLRGERISGYSQDFKLFDEIHRIRAGKFRRYHGLAANLDPRQWFYNLRDGVRIARGWRQANKIIRRIKPDVVFSKGGYVAVPIGLAAHRAGVAIVTHDSDTLPGLANRILGRWAEWHAVGWPADNYTQYYQADKTKFTGTPVAGKLKAVGPKEQAAAKTALGLDPKLPVLLIGGAGLGSRDLNNLIVASAPSLLQTEDGLRILHLCGDKHLSEVRQAYIDELGQAVYKRSIKLAGFTDDFPRWCAAADLIVSRAGASSLAEFAAQAKACLIIPSPWLSGGHQLTNARKLADAKAVVLAENDIQPDGFARTVSQLLNDPERRRQLGQRLAKQAKPQAAAEIARLILETSKKNDFLSAPNLAASPGQPNANG